MDTTNEQLSMALQATGELLQRRGQRAAIVVVGGTARQVIGHVRAARR